MNHPRSRHMHCASWRFRESQPFKILIFTCTCTSGSNEGSSFGVRNGHPFVKNCQIYDNIYISVLATHGQHIASFLDLNQVVRMVWLTIFDGVGVFIMPSRTLTEVETTFPLAFWSLVLHRPQNRYDEPPRMINAGRHSCKQIIVSVCMQDDCFNKDSVVWKQLLSSTSHLVIPQWPPPPPLGTSSEMHLYQSDQQERKGASTSGTPNSMDDGPCTVNPANTNRPASSAGQEHLFTSISNQISKVFRLERMYKISSFDRWKNNTTSFSFSQKGNIHNKKHKRIPPDPVISFLSFSHLSHAYQEIRKAQKPKPRVPGGYKTIFRRRRRPPQ